MQAKDQTVKRVVELARGKYRGFNDHHLTEKLNERGTDRDQSGESATCPSC